jgi:hypothetical protein
MENIVIEGSSHCPSVDFNLNGNLKIEGRSIPEDINKLFNPLLDFVSDLTVEKINFDVNLEYFNTATSKKLLELFKKIESNKNIEEIKIKWHFEEGDDDSVEMAEIYEECLSRTKFEFHEYAEATA